MRYRMRLRRLFPDVDPQKVGERLEKLIETHDERFTEQEMLADARKTSSPLHRIFEWSNNTAAEKYRIRQARAFLRDLQTSDRGRKPTQAFVYVRHPKHGHKKVILGIRTMVGTPELRQQVVERRMQAGLKSLKGWLVQYGGSEEFRRVRKHAERMRHAIERELLQSVLPKDRIRLETPARRHQPKARAA